MICPICQGSKMLEPAPEMYQCPNCGNGQGSGGFHFAWSLSYLTWVDFECVGVVCLFNKLKNRYEFSSICWTIDENADPIPASVMVDDAEHLTEDVLGEHALPVVWLQEPSGKLRSGMYRTLLGTKEKN